VIQPAPTSPEPALSQYIRSECRGNQRRPGFRTQHTCPAHTHANDASRAVVVIPLALPKTATAVGTERAGHVRMAGMAELEEIIRLVEQSLDEPGLDAGELAKGATPWTS
jgi:hypothetical protein